MNLSVANARYILHVITCCARLFSSAISVPVLRVAMKHCMRIIIV
jgi:hypothetical protein